jgi:hypothetical protein
MASYEYTRSSIKNNVIMQSKQISTGAQTESNISHTNKYGRVHGVTAIDILTGTVTYNALQGSGYGFSIPFTGVPADKEVDAMNDPYRVPARLTVLGGKSPQSYNYRTLG